MSNMYRMKHTGNDLDDAIGYFKRLRDADAQVLDSSEANPFNLDTLTREGIFVARYVIGVPDGVPKGVYLFIESKKESSKPASGGTEHTFFQSFIFKGLIVSRRIRFLQKTGSDVLTFSSKDNWDGMPKVGGTESDTATFKLLGAGDDTPTNKKMIVFKDTMVEPPMRATELNKTNTHIKHTLLKNKIKLINKIKEG